MNVWIYPAFLGTLISITGLTMFAKSRYDSKHPRTLSEMATISDRSMMVFRLILYPCAVLFGVTNLAYVAPLSSQPTSIAVAAIIMCGSEMVLAALPARGRSSRYLHNVFAYIMGASMFSLALFYVATLSGGPRQIIIGIIGLMATLSMGCWIDKKRFIFYELPYIYLSHLSILIVAVSLRPKF